MSKVVTAGGVAGVGFLAAGIGLPKVIEAMSPQVAYALAIIGAVLLLTTFVWSILNKGSAQGDGSTGQTTHGPHSPAFGTVHGGVSINHAAPAATQPLKSPYGTAQHKSPPQQVPRGKIWEAVEWVAKAIGDGDHERCFPEARRALRQAALDGRISMFGRKEITPSYMSAPEECVEVWSRIKPDYWNDWRLTEMATGPLHDERPHTAAEPHIRTGLMSGRYWALRVDESQVRNEWPQKSPTAARSATQIPKRDATLASGLVYALTGSWDSPVLDTLLSEANVDGFNYRKREFERDAKAGKLTIWGRERLMDVFSGDDWDLIEPEFWESNRVSWDNMILGDTAKTESRSGFGNADQYEDLMINRAEFEERWPNG